MNAKRTFALVALLIFMMTITAAQAGPRPGGGSRSGGMSRSAGMSRSMARPQFAGPRMGGAPFQRSTFQRPNNNFAGTNRFAHSPRTSANFNRANFNRANFNRSRVNLSRSGNLNRSGTNWNNWNGRRGNFANRNGNWRRGRDCDDRFVFFDPFWFPGYFPYWYWGYPSYYSFYPYPGYDSYSYDPYGSSGYGYPVSGQMVYPSGSDYSDEEDYADSRGGAETRSYDGNARTNRSILARVQERLARAGYYKGPIDGVQGSRTYYAIRAYQRDHKLRVDGAVSDQLLSEMGLQ